MLPSEPKISIFASVFWALVLFAAGIGVGRFVLSKKSSPAVPPDSLKTLQIRVLSLEDSLDCVSWHLQDTQKKLSALESIYSDIQDQP